MSVISTGDFAKDLEPLQGMWVDMGYGRYGDDYKKVFKVRNIDKAYVEDAMISDLGLFQQKREGDATRYDKMRQLYEKRYSPTAYSLGCKITHEQIQDGIALDIAERVLRNMGSSAADTVNTIAYNVIGRAFNSSYTGADGKELCATDHPTEEGTTSNELASAASLSEASLKQAFIEMKSMKTLRGNKRMVNPNKLLVPRDLLWDAQILVKSVGRTGTADNDINPIKSEGLFPGGVVSSDWLTSATNWFIISDADQNGLQLIMRESLRTFRDRDFETMNVCIMSYLRFDAGWTDYNHLFGSAI